MRSAAVNLAVLTVLFSCGPASGSAAAQSSGVDRAQPEETEPRIVGKRGMTAVGIAGFMDRFYSSEQVFPTNYTVQVDGLRFLTKRFAVRLGVVGTGSFGGDASNDDANVSGPGAPAIHGLGGVLFYFTPQSVLSVYLGSEYWMQVTQREAGDNGSIVGKAGIQGALSSRASFFVEGGFGTWVTRGSEGELLTRIVGQVGIRIKL